MENKQSNMQVVLVDQHGDGDDDEARPPGISVANFDYSVENHLKAVNKILELSGESTSEYDQSEIQRMSSSVSFLREWRHFCYRPQAIRFACQSETPGRNDATSGILNLTQFSSAAVPKDISGGDKVSSHSSKDFVMYVGGLVWALDWCPRVHERPDGDINLEFIAVAAHPPESSYHKIGAPLSGRGVIQIWCLLNPCVKDHDMSPQVKKKSKMKSSSKKATQPTKPRGRPRKNPIVESINLYDNNQHLPEDSTKLLLTDGRSHDTLQLVATEDNIKNAKLSAPKRPRGRPKKNQLKESIDNLDHSNKHHKSLKCHEVSSNMDKVCLETPEKISKDTCREQNASINSSSVKPNKPMGNVRKTKTKDSADNMDSSNQCVKPLAVEFPENNINGNNQYLKPLAIKFHEDSSKLLEVDEISMETPEIVSNEDDEGKTHDKGLPEKSVPIALKSSLTKCKLRSRSSGCGQDLMRSSEDTNLDSCYIPEDVALPRLIMCLAHNGKVAWDVKWRPFDTCVNSKHRMGYLAVLLGNGALEVWEVPVPHAAEVMFSACQKEGTDPRFMKLEPVFRCSMLKCGDRQSIPLTLEWSTSSPHDLILAGCHDGVVALWKFSADGPLKDTRPLLCFSADTVPIRALAWSPSPSGSEGANVIVTAGHKGAKFWDIRDPFHPLWDVNPVQRIIYGLDWHPDPRCVVLSFDDGEIQIISILRSAYDVPVTGESFVAAQRQASHSYHCTSSSISSIQVSRLTGMVAYCCSDGKVLHFQLTTKAVEKDPARNREPHYLCGAVDMEESALTVLTPLPGVPFPMKKSCNKWADTPGSKRGYVSLSNQEKRAKEQMLKCQPPEDQPSALCYDDNGPGSDDSGPDESSKSKSKKKARKDEVGEVLPPKIVGMHRVRWNMNKGSERWLCYGGAAGILRCQQIT